jgi:DNA-binding transcriptional LysR family regulator
MDVGKLAMLLTVVEQGSYAKAGEHLHLSHSAIHRQVRLLEAELSCRVLVRAGRRVELTAVGQILVTVAQRIRREVEQGRRQIEEMAGLKAGCLRIGTGHTALIFFLPAVLERFRKMYPEVDLTITAGTAGRVLPEIQAGNLDVGIVFGRAESPPGGRPLCFDALYREEFVVVVGPKHPLAGRKFVRFSQLSGDVLILNPRASHLRGLLEQRFQQAGLSPRIGMELDNEEAIEKLVGIDMGVGILSRQRAIRDRIHYLRIADGPIYCEVGLVYAKSSYVPHALAEFARLCREVGRGMEHSQPKSRARA